MRAELRHISPNDFLDWECFAAAERAEPWDDFGWFSLSIGLERDPGTEIFQVLVATPAAVSRAMGKCSRFRGIIVESFEAEIIAGALREHVSAVTGGAWPAIVEQLRQFMFWEYEDLRGI
jgi:hypothetical protein